jgi:hypothetical protein
MKNLLFLYMLAIAIPARSQERYIGLTRDSITKFHAKYFETLTSNDTAMVVKVKSDGTTWRYFKFDKASICEVAGWEVQFYNGFTDLEKKLKSKKYKNTGEIEYNFVVQKVKGAKYTNRKETYILMYGAINPNMSASTRAVIYYKGK